MTTTYQCPTCASAKIACVHDDAAAPIAAINQPGSMIYSIQEDESARDKFLKDALMQMDYKTQKVIVFTNNHEQVLKLSEWYKTYLPQLDVCIMTTASKADNKTETDSPAAPTTTTIISPRPPPPCSVPEPPPIHRGTAVFPRACELVGQTLRMATPFAPPEGDIQSIHTLLTQRHNFGMGKYGQPLMTQDGRNDIEDMRQELGDLIMYMTKAIMNGQDLRPIGSALWYVNELFHVWWPLLAPKNAFKKSTEE